MSFLDRRKASRRKEDHERDRLFELSLDMLAVMGNDGMFHQVNASWSNVTGFSDEELKAKPVIDVVHRDDQPAFAAAFERLRTDAATMTFEGRCRSKVGPPRWLEWTASADPENEVIYLAARDIMGRKLAEAESARLAAIVDSSNDAIVSASLAGMIESWNPAAERIFGYKASEVLGRPLTMLVPRLSTDMTPQMLSQVKAGDRVTQLETDRRRKDGTMVKVALTISPVRDAMGMVVASSVIAREIHNHA